MERKEREGDMENEIMTTSEVRGGSGSAKRSRRKIFWGLVLIVGAVVMLMSKLGLLGGMSFAQIAFSVIATGIFLYGMFRRSFGQMLFSLALLIILNDKFLHLEAITPWWVLLAAAVITAGLNMLFPGFHKKRHIRFNMGWNSKTPGREDRTEGSVSYENLLCGTVKYIVGEVEEVYLNNCFGGIEVFFNDAVLKNGSAKVHLENYFGGVELFVPADWQVVMNVETIFGSAEETGSRKPFGENVLYVNGEAAFGGVEVHYI